MLKRVSILCVYLLVTVLIIGCSPNINKGIVSTVDTDGNSKNGEIIVKLEIIKSGIYTDDTNYSEVDIQANDVTLRDIVADTVMVTDKVNQGDVFLEHVTIHDALQVYGNEISVFVSDAKIANIVATSSKNLRLLFQKGVEITETLEVKETEVIFDGAFVIKKPMKLENSVVKLQENAITPVLHLSKGSKQVEFIIDGYVEKVIVHSDEASKLVFKGKGAIGKIENLGQHDVSVVGELTVEEMVTPNKKIKTEEKTVVKEARVETSKPVLVEPEEEIVESIPQEIKKPKPPVIVPKEWILEETKDGFTIQNMQGEEVQRIAYILFKDVLNGERVAFDVNSIQKQKTSILIKQEEYEKLINGSYVVYVFAEDEILLKEARFEVTKAKDRIEEIRIVDFYQEENGDLKLVLDDSLQFEELKSLSFKTHHYDWTIEEGFSLDKEILSVPYALFEKSRLYSNLWYDLHVETHNKNKVILPIRMYFKQGSLHTPKYQFGSYRLGKGSVILDDIRVSNTDENAIGLFLDGKPIEQYHSGYADYISYEVAATDDGYIIRNFTMDVGLFPLGCQNVTISLLPPGYGAGDVVDGFYASLLFRVCDEYIEIPMDKKDAHEVEIENP